METNSDLQNFLAKGGEIKVIPPSSKQAKPTKFKKFSRSELEQILFTLKSLGSADTLVISNMLDMSISKVNSALSVAESHGKVKSSFIKNVKIWQVV
ncbi:hypothetical protein [Acinetobacter thermotolerans]|uniref:hypothetical protein n=1 Tax=Acinetobacter thermotolerans TaxID=3151487 RepID=UPI00325B956B